MKYLLPIILFLVFIPIISAADLDYYNVEYKVDNNVQTTITLQFTEPTDLTDFELDLPLDVKNIQLTIEDQEGSGDIKNAKSLTITYSTKKYLEGSKHFLTNFKLPFSTKSLKTTLILPEGTVLANTIEDSIFPYPDNVKSDGQHIIIEWSKTDLEAQENLSYFVIFKEKFLLISYISSALIVILTIILIIILTKKPKKTATPKKRKKSQNIEFHLKEDEKQVIRVLKKKNGQCSQATIRVITDLSKAKLSRILKELEERKVVHREEKGNKKIVTLKKAAWNILEQDED